MLHYFVSFSCSSWFVHLSLVHAGFAVIFSFYCLIYFLVHHFIGFIIFPKDCRWKFVGWLSLTQRCWLMCVVLINMAGCYTNKSKGMWMNQIYTILPKPSGANVQYFHFQTNENSIREISFISTPLIIAASATLNWQNMQGMYLHAQLLADSKTERANPTKATSNRHVVITFCAWGAQHKHLYN